MNTKKVRMPWRFKVSSIGQLKALAVSLNISPARAATIALEAGLQALKDHLIELEKGEK